MASGDDALETDSPATQGNSCRGSVVAVTSSEFCLTLSTKEGQTLQLKVGRVSRRFHFQCFVAYSASLIELKCGTNQRMADRGQFLRVGTAAVRMMPHRGDASYCQAARFFYCFV